MLHAAGRLSLVSLAHSMNARKFVHVQKPMYKSPWIKQGRRKRKKRGRETVKTEARRLTARKAAQQNKNTSEELKQGLSTPSKRRKAKLPLATLGVIGKTTLWADNNKAWISDTMKEMSTINNLGKSQNYETLLTSEIVKSWYVLVDCFESVQPKSIEGDSNKTDVLANFDIIMKI